MIVLILHGNVAAELSRIAVANGLPASTPFEPGITYVEFCRRVEAARKRKMN